MLKGQGKGHSYGVPLESQVFSRRLGSMSTCYRKVLAVPANEGTVIDDWITEQLKLETSPGVSGGV